MGPETSLALQGELDLRFSRKSGRTILKDAYQSPPLKVSRMLYPHSQERAVAYLVETSGGMVSGDTYIYRIYLEEGADVTLIPQSAVKVYPQTKSRDTLQEFVVDIEKKGVLILQPDTLIPYKDASFTSRTTVRMDGEASIIWGEILTPGRRERREAWQYQKLDTSFSLWLDGELKCLDRLRLEPDVRHPHEIGILDGRDYYASFWAAGSVAEAVEAEAFQSHLSIPEGTRAAVTKPEDNVIHMRILSSDLISLKKLWQQAAGYFI